MSLVINRNLIAMNANLALNRNYTRLGVSIQRLSTGLRINSAGDDPAGLAIRELMRSDIAVMYQGWRNAADGVSMIQTAEGAMATIDEKLTRMKELAEQAATGTYTTLQREILNSEYQAMAMEIDRIASATEFNGIKLLDGSITRFHVGDGLKVHFGGGNNAAEDYYMVDIGDVRATVNTGLRIGGDGLQDIHRQTESAQGFDRLDAVIARTSAQAGDFTYYYNYTADPLITSAELRSYSFIAGIYRQESGATLQHLINDINQGTASRVQLNFGDQFSSAHGTIADLAIGSGEVLNICVGDEIYQLGSGPGAERPVNGLDPIFIDIAGRGSENAAVLVGSFLESSSQNFYSLVNSADNYVMIYCREGGDNDNLFGCDDGSRLAAAADRVFWTNVETGEQNNSGVNFSLGGETWGRAGWEQNQNNHRFYFTLTGQMLGDNYDLIIASAGTLSPAFNTLSAFSADDFEEIQDASWGEWSGAQIRTQSHAQEALEAIERAINEKDVIRGHLGAIQNRLENTLNNLGIMTENLQASESRISDVDYATEMTEMTRRNIMAQVAASMLAQANTLPQMALTLLG